MASGRYRMRKEEQEYNPSNKQTRDQEIAQTSTKPLAIVVYFKDGNAVEFSVDDGQNCKAGELFEMVVDEMKFPPIAHELFSLWLVSDLLEVQLRPSQVPFHLACYWVELLSKYSTAKIEDTQIDEPVIVFQRNVFYPLSSEIQHVQEPALLRLLYHEAKHNVVDDRYIFNSLEEYDRLAGLQALMSYRTFDQTVHTPAYYCEKIKDFYPEQIWRKEKWRWLWHSRDSLEDRLAHQHQMAASSYPNVSADPRQGYLPYLDMCRSLPFYGAAYFRGQIEQPLGSGWISGKDLPVFLACNTQGITIFDMDEAVPLINLSYKEFFWEYAEPNTDTGNSASPTHKAPNPDEMSCIFIYLKLIIDGETCPRFLQFFSRESVMIDGILRGCLELDKSQNTTQTEIQPIQCNRPWQNIDKLVLKAAATNDS